MSNLFDISGRTAVITGGAGILGRTFVRGFVEEGANVVLVDRDRQAIEALMDVLASDLRHQVLPIVCDVCDPGEVTAMVERAVAKFGSLEILLNNHVTPPADPGEFFATFEDYSLAEWKRVMSVNLDSMFTVAQAVGRQLVAQGKGGSVIFTSSIYGVMASDKRIYDGSLYRGYSINNPAVYSASKAGVVGLMRWLSTYWADRSIRVNAVAPGGVYSGENDVFQAKYSARVPMGRMAAQNEIVGAMLYLASDASSYMTGQVMVVDGGLSAW
jgi:NAD(P)-dependent dehydrogenase (short-subunit alcohol dehydrogenase family)